MSGWPDWKTDGPGLVAFAPALRFLFDFTSGLILNSARRCRAPHARDAGAPCRRVGAQYPARRVPCFSTHSNAKWQTSHPAESRLVTIRFVHSSLWPARRISNSNFKFEVLRFPLRHRYDAFSDISRKYFDGGNTPDFASSRPTLVRISSAQSAQVSSLIPRCLRAA